MNSNNSVHVDQLSVGDIIYAKHMITTTLHKYEVIETSDRTITIKMLHNPNSPITIMEKDVFVSKFHILELILKEKPLTVTHKMKLNFHWEDSEHVDPLHLYWKLSKGITEGNKFCTFHPNGSIKQEVPTQIVIVGAGGFAREVLVHMNPSSSHVLFAVEDEYFDQTEPIKGYDLIRTSVIDFENSAIIVAIADPRVRSRVVSSLYHHNPTYLSFVHQSALILGEALIGEGTFIGAGCIITTDVKIGDHVQLNLNTTVGHDSNLNHFVTTAPSVNISGNCDIHHCVYLGTQACVKQGIVILRDNIIGMNATVTKNILTEGDTYVGTPAQKLQTKST